MSVPTKIPLDSLSEWSSFTSKIRGETLEQKFDQILQRYRKVVSDSSSDTSEYRINFSQAHLWVVGELEAFSINSALSKEKILSGVAIEAWAQIKVDILTPGSINNGRRDAFAIIALEIASVLEWSNV